MASHVAHFRPRGGPTEFNLGSFSSMFMDLIRDHDMVSKSMSETALDRIPLSSTHLFGNKHILRWAALNILCWLHSRRIDPSLSVESVAISRVEGIYYDIVMSAADKGVRSTFRVVVEEMSGDSFRLSIISLDDNQNLGPIFRTIFNNLNGVQWTRTARIVSY